MAEADDVRFILLGNAHLDFPDILNYLCADLGLLGGDLNAEQQNQRLREALAEYANRGQAVALSHRRRPSFAHQRFAAIMGIRGGDWRTRPTSARGWYWRDCRRSRANCGGGFTDCARSWNRSGCVIASND